MVTITASGANISEDNTGTQILSFTVQLDQVATGNLWVPWRAVSGSEGITASGTAFFSPGRAPVAQVNVRYTADLFPEPDKSVGLELLQPWATSTQSAGFPGDAPTYQTVAWLRDDDGFASPRALWVSDPVVLEGASRAIIYDLQLSRPATQAISIPYTLEGSAEAGSDYADRSGLISFAAGQTSASLRVPLRNDSVAEGVEHLNLALDLPNSIAESFGGQATILDPDGLSPNVPIITVAAPDITEGNSSTQTMRFSIALSEPASASTSIPWRLANDGTATLGIDTSGTQISGSAFISAGRSSADVFVRVAGDTQTGETDEGVVLEVLQSANASLPGNATALQTVGWIFDDDGTSNPLALHILSPTLRENDSGDNTASFVFELSRVAPRDITLNYRTVDGTATAGLDYVDSSGTVTIREGQRTASVGVDIIADNCFETNETFSLQVARPGSIAAISGGTATIVNDDLVTDVCRIVGLNSAEVIRGGVFDEVILGKRGNDRILANDGNDLAYGDAGNDKVFGQRGNDKVYGGTGNDRVSGDAGDDVVKGNGGDDRTDGGSGNDRMFGGAGDDSMFGQSGNDRMYGQNDDDRVFGGGGNDRMYGDRGEDELDGQGGNDFIKGGDDEDVVTGGNGNDRMFGGKDEDCFIFDRNDGRDTILDFAVNEDQIKITSGADRLRDLTIEETPNGKHTLVSWDNTEILLWRVDPGDLDSGDFVFS